MLHRQLAVQSSQSFKFSSFHFLNSRFFLFTSLPFGTSNLTVNAEFSSIRVIILSNKIATLPHVLVKAAYQFLPLCPQRAFISLIQLNHHDTNFISHFHQKESNKFVPLFCEGNSSQFVILCYCFFNCILKK